MQPDAGRPADWDGHLVLVHDCESQRRAGLAAWVRRGLDLGAKILYIERPDEPVERALAGVLRADGIDARDAMSQGQLEVFRAHNAGVFRPDWQAQVLRAALADGYPSVRWSGEAHTAWSVISPGAHADLEWATDELCRTRPVSVLCQYPTRLWEPTMQTVLAMHGGGLRGSLLQTSPVRGGLAIAGEVDCSNAKILHSALAAASAGRQGRDSFVVELGGVDFLDVAGTRAFITGTDAHRARGGVVWLVGAQRPVGRLLHLLGLDPLEGFRFEGSS